METDLINWLKLPIIYPITSDFLTDEELSEVDRIQLNNVGLLEDFETTDGYYNLSNDAICQLNPKCFVPKSKDGERKNKKYYTEIIFESGNIVYALGKPVTVYEAINSYVDSLPTITGPGK